MAEKQEAPKPQPKGEEGAQPHPDSAILIGGPGQEPVETGTPAAEAPQLQKVKVGGREFDLTPEIAEAIRQREADYEKGIQRQGQELAQLRQATQEWQRVRQALVPEQKTVSLGTKLFEDPDGALKAYEDQILNKVRQEYAQVEATKQFWSDFYDKHQDLKPAKRVVQAVFQENLPRLANASIPQAMEEIASMSRTELLSVIKAFNGGRSPDETSSRAVVESPTGPRQQKPKEEESKFKSLGDVIKARRAARRAPARKET